MSERRREFTWEDPERLHMAIADSSGLDLLLGIASQSLPAPPINVTLGMTVLEVTEGRTVISLTPDEWHYNQTGNIHGSIAAALLDSAMGSAVQTGLRAGQSYTTLDLSVRYLRPATKATGELRCTGSVVSLGRRVATAAGQVTDTEGKIIATGTTSCLIFSPDV